MNKILAICPGSFDPVTVGHLDIIKRAAKMFEEVIVVVMTNSSKHPSFTAEERMEMIGAATADIPNVSVDKYDGLLADYAAMRGAGAIVKGLRAMSDFEYEFQMALANRKINAKLDTIFLTTSVECMYLSSSLVREIGRHGGDISGFVPDAIRQRVFDKLYQK